MCSRQQCSAETELCEVYCQPDLEHSTDCWIILQFFSILRQQKWLPRPSLWKDALEVKGGGGSGLCWLLWGRFSITDLDLGTLSWAVHECVGGFTAVCLSLCCGLHLPLYPSETDLMKALEQSLWPCWKPSVCIPMTYPHPCKTKLNWVKWRGKGVERLSGEPSVFLWKKAWSFTSVKLDMEHPPYFLTLLSFCMLWPWCFSLSHMLCHG